MTYSRGGDSKGTTCALPIRFATGLGSASPPLRSTSTRWTLLQGPLPSPSSATTRRLTPYSLPSTLSPQWLAGRAQPTQFPVEPTVCDMDYEHMSGPSGMPMRGCTPKSTGVPDHQITNAQASALELHVIDVDTGAHACRMMPARTHHPRACMHGLIILDEGIFCSNLTKGHACWLSR
jgi:hypothetical protein